MRSYVAAAGEAVATNASQPWNIFSAFGRDAVSSIADRLGRWRRRRQDEARDEEEGQYKDANTEGMPSAVPAVLARPVWLIL